MTKKPKKPVKPPSSPRVSIYLPDGLRDLLSGSDSLSRRIGAVATRYAFLTDESMPELTRDEWCAVLEANSGVFPLDRPAQPALLWANVADAKGLDTKWGVDIGQLVETLRGWTAAETMAAIEACGRFDQSNKPVDQSLADCGCRIRRD